MLLANVYYFYSPSLYLLHYSISKTNYKLLNLLFCIYLVGARPGVGVYFSLTLTHNSIEKISSIVYLLLCHFFTFVHSYNPPHTTYSSFGPSQMSILTTFPFTPNVVFLPFFLNLFVVSSLRLFSYYHFKLGQKKFLSHYQLPHSNILVFGLLGSGTCRNGLMYLLGSFGNIQLLLWTAIPFSFSWVHSVTCPPLLYYKLKFIVFRLRPYLAESTVSRPINCS